MHSPYISSSTEAQMSIAVSFSPSSIEEGSQVLLVKAISSTNYASNFFYSIIRNRQKILKASIRERAHTSRSTAKPAIIEHEVDTIITLRISSPGLWQMMGRFLQCRVPSTQSRDRWSK
eukprot:TRINITY_DN13407_c0_g1_i1.p1 TRINITY_DN13407_c0_g1~~TRINITY_DN13407_c0_g1_i1.p1  ORF type:complete len:119 (-),score=8.51 TRINITY_DN13407_c0_g1_i1:16-372(-)